MSEVKIFYNTGDIQTIQDANYSYHDGAWFVVERSNGDMESYSAFAVEKIVEIMGDD